jgi:hypothetical protein
MSVVSGLRRGKQELAVREAIGGKSNEQNGAAKNGNDPKVMI